MDRSIKSNPITCNYVNENLTVSIMGEFRTKEWSACFGDIQSHLEEKLFKGMPVCTVRVDLSKCTWIDPIPLLSLLIALSQFKDSLHSSDIVVETYLPGISINENKTITGTSKSAGIVLKFLAQEGFLEKFVKLGPTYTTNKQNMISICEDDQEISIKKLTHIPTVLNYLNCFVIPATIENLIRIDSEKHTIKKDIDVLIKKLINKYENNITNKLPSYARESFIINLHHILKEITDNVCEHAYPKRENAFVGIYVRYRMGLANNESNRGIDSHQKKRITQLSKKEMENTFQLNNEIVDTLPGFFEVFIVDNGVGMKETMCEKHFETAFLSTLLDGKRKANKTSLSAYGGIKLIKDILSETSDFIFSHEEYTWVGLFANEKEPVKENIFSKEPDIINNRFGGSTTPVKGLSWNFRLTWIPDNARQNQVMYYKDKVSTNPIYRVYKDFSTIDVIDRNDVMDSVYFLDQRVTTADIDFDTAYSNIKQAQALRNPHNYVLLPEDIFTKNNLINTIELYTKRSIFDYLIENGLFSKNEVNLCLEHTQYSKLRDALCFDDPKILKAKVKKVNWYISTILDILDKHSKKMISSAIEHMKKESLRELVILDIPSYQILPYFYSLNELPIKGHDLFKYTPLLFDRIVVVSQQFETVIFTKDSEGNCYIYEEIASEQFCNDRDSGKGISFYFSWLRRHDSLLIWEEMIGSENKQDYFFNTNIKWSNSKYINGYINLERVLSNTKIFKMLIRSVNRLYGLFPNKQTYCIFTDILTKRLAEECNLNNMANKENDLLTDVKIAEIQKDKSQRIRLSSVVVTGETRDIGRINNNEADLSLFCHPDYFEKDTGCLVQWLSQVSIDRFFEKDVKTHRRIGKTYLIANSEDGSIIINKKSMQNSKVYHCDTDKMYYEVQHSLPEYFRLGHYNYDGYHSMISFRFNTQLKDSEQSEKGLFPYLLSQFILNLAKEDLTNGVPEGFFGLNPRWMRIIKYYYNEFKLNKWDFTNKAMVVVYQSHYFSDYAINMIKKYLPKEMHRRIIPIYSIKPQKGYSNTISPFSARLIKNQMEKGLLEKGQKNALLFDTLIVSGRTRKELKHLLLSQKNGENEKVFDQIKTLCIIDSQRLPFEAPDPARHQAYYRLDIPRMGQKNNCQLCTAISMAKEFNGELSGKNKDEETKNRIKEWISFWGAVSTLDNDMQKIISVSEFNPVRFGIDQNFDPEITTTLGLMLYSLELRSTHFDDDFLTDILDAKNENGIDLLSTEMKMLLICIQILYFGKFDSNHYHERIIQTLLNCMRMSSDSAYTSLSALILLLQDVHLVARIIYKEILNSDYIYTQNNEGNATINTDYKLVLAWLASKNDYLYFGLPGMITTLLAKTYEKALIYTQIHNTLYNDHSHNHNHALYNYIFGPISSNKEFINIAKRAIEELKTFISTLKKLDDLPVQMEMIENDAATIIKKLRTLINDTTIQYYDSCNENTDIVVKAEKLYKNFLDVHFMFLIPMGKHPDHQERCVESLLRKIAEDKYGDKMVLEFFKYPETKRSEIWYFWDSSFNTVIDDLLLNLYVNGEECPFRYKGKQRYGIISVTFLEHMLIIEIKNLSLKPVEEVRKACIANTKPAQVNLKKGFNVNFEYKEWSSPRIDRQENEHFVKVIVSIPSTLYALNNLI